MPRTLFQYEIAERRNTLPMFLSLRLSDEWSEPRPWRQGNETLPYVGWRVTRRENGRLLTVVLGPLQILAATAAATPESFGAGSVGRRR